MIDPAALPGTKRCSKCQTHKSPSDFHQNRKAPDGLSWYCKACAISKSREWYKNNPEKVRAQAARNDPARYRGPRLKRKYGITEDEYDALLAAQGGVCAICGETEKIKDGRKMAVDHNHTTGKVRGILCSHCNRAIGLLQDNPALLRRAADYLG